jgi:Holliday junction resolvasome RuvABC endonuclease subunit
MIYLGIDPSFTKTGAVLLDDELKTIKFLAISPPGSNTDYASMLNRSAHISIGIIRQLDLHREVISVIEEPLLTSQRASVLGVLSASLSWALAYIPCVREMYSINPSYVSSLNRPIMKEQGLNKKQASQYVVERILEHFTNVKGYSIEIYNEKTNKDGTMKARILSHDEAESFLLLLTLLMHKGVVNDLDMRFLGSLNRKFFRDTKLNKILSKKE